MANGKFAGIRPAYMQKYLVTAILLFFSHLSFEQTGQNSSITKPTTAICILHASIVNVVTGKIDVDQAIIINSSRITDVGPSNSITAPPNATVIDASGQFVMPGMTDAHIHFFQSGGLYTRPDGLNLNAVYPYEKDQQWIKDNFYDLMARYLACGITTVIDVGGPMSNYARRELANAAIASPTAFVTGPLVSTYTPPNLDKMDPPIITVRTPEEARRLVRVQLPHKPDFIKIWYIVLPGQKADSTLPMVRAAIEESHANGLKVCVHATEYETAKLAVTAGADILVHSVDDKVLDNEMLELLKSHHTVYIPTLLVAQNYDRTFTQQFDFSAHDFKYANPFMLGTVMDIRHIEKMPFDFKKIRTRFPVPSKADSTMLTNLKLAQDAGILVVAGTDAGNIGTQHASSFQDELDAMKQAGLSNWEIIKSATINTAKGFGNDKEYGSIEKGKIADFLILSKDPTQDLNIPANIQTIVHRGVPMKQQQLLPVTPEILVQQQLNGYNARNIDAFLAPYSDDVKMYNAAGKVISKGKNALKKEYTKLFENTPELHCEVVKRTVQGNTVSDQEKVTGAGEQPVTATVIYTIENGKIIKVVIQSEP